MNYTKTLREYCLCNPGSLFDVSILKDTHFPMIPYKTLLKILNRLEEEKIISKVSKGVYLIKDKLNHSFDQIVMEDYVSGTNGMYVGYTMYNKYEISDHKDEFIEVYTNKMHTKHKNIENYKLTYVPVPFTVDVVNMIKTLELIQKGYRIIDVNNERYFQEMDLPLAAYSDETFAIVNEAIKYNYSTICTLKNKLDKYGIPNKCLEIYNKKYSVE